MISSQEFTLGKHNLHYVDSDLLSYTDSEFTTSQILPTSQKLPRNMTDAEIESELKPGLCTLGDLLSFLDNAPKEYKDGWANLFYFPSCVVYVHWYAGGGWYVYADLRDDCHWHGVDRVFSSATGAQTLISGHSDSLDLDELKVVSSVIDADGDGVCGYICTMSDGSIWGCDLNEENWVLQKPSDIDLTKAFKKNAVDISK